MKLNDIDLNKLGTFLAVVEAGGVSRAAARIGRTASAVSQSVGHLESSLGCKLFDRVGKQLVLTRGGQALTERLSDYQALLERTLGELAGDGAEANGLVRLGLFLGFPRLKSRDLLVTFAERFAQAQVRVVYAPQHDLEARLRKNRLDFVLSFRPRSADAADLVSTRLFEQELVLVSGPSFFARGFSLEALARTPVVDYYQSDPLIARWLTHHFPDRRLEPHVRFWAATTDLVLELVQSGAGVGVLPRHMVRGRALRASTLPGKPGERLKIVGPAGQPLVDHVWLNEPRAAYRDATQRAFRDVVLSVLARPAGERRGAARSPSGVLDRPR